MKRLIANSPNGLQVLYYIESTGGYSDPARVVWNEHVDGPLDESALESLGGLVRVGNALTVDPALLAAHQAAQTAAANALTQKQQRVAQARQAINAALLGNADPDLTPLQIRQLFRFFRVALKDVAAQL